MSDHPKVQYGYCSTCGHYGADCTGTRVPAANGAGWAVVARMEDGQLILRATYRDEHGRGPCPVDIVIYSLAAVARVGRFLLDAPAPRIPGDDLKS